MFEVGDDDNVIKKNNFSILSNILMRSVIHKNECETQMRSSFKTMKL